MGLRGSSTGVVKPCTSPCATCYGNEQQCLTCVTGFAINGTQCLCNSRAETTMVLGGGSGSTPMFLDTDDQATQVYKGFFGLNRLMHALCKKLPSKYYDTSSHQKCRRHIKCNRLKWGSLSTSMSVDASAFPNSATASS